MSYKKFGNNISQEQIIAYIKATYIHNKQTFPVPLSKLVEPSMLFDSLEYYID